MKIIHEDADGKYIVVMDHHELCSAPGRGVLSRFAVGSEVDILDVAAIRDRLQKAFEALRPIVSDEVRKRKAAP
jgi:hypothetical protein